MSVEVLKGIRIIEFAGRGPGPFCAMMLADMGAEVIRIEPKGGLATLNKGSDPLLRGRRRLTLNLKMPAGLEIARELIKRSDALIEGNRPGVMERLGIGPKDCLCINPKLVYGRVTGWGQEGPLAQRPGRDINYIALSGVLSAIGAENPIPPLNLVGDFGGGGMLLAVGILAAILQSRCSGRGQVVDASMLDGAALLMTSVFGLLSNQQWKDERQENLLDGGAPFYRAFKCADNGWIAVGALDERSLNALYKLLKITDVSPAEAWVRSNWPYLQERFEATFRMRTRDEWCEDPHAEDACVCPVLSLREVPQHPHNLARKTFFEASGSYYPAPAPRFSDHPFGTASTPGEDEQTRCVLTDLLALDEMEVQRLRANGAIE